MLTPVGVVERAFRFEESGLRRLAFCAGLLALAACSSTPTGAPASTQVAVARTLTPTVLLVRSASPTMPSETASPTEVTVAKDAVERYTAALVRGDLPTAWALLAPETQAHWSSLANFTYDRSAYFKSVAGRYSITVWPKGIDPITDFLGATDGASIDLRHAVLVWVDYPALALDNAYSIYIVSPGTSGPELFDVR
jgi:hypothetical protein